MRLLSCLCVVLGLTMSAQALITESESNNTLASANVIVSGALPWSELGAMALGGQGGDVDIFKLSLTLNNVLSAESTPVQPFFTSPDTRLGLFDAGGVLRAVDNNSPNAGASSSLLYQVPASGVYYLAVTGGTDLNFTGEHAQAGPYILSLGLAVPEPATLAFLGLGALVCLRRTRH